VTTAHVFFVLGVLAILVNEACIVWMLRRMRQESREAVQALMHGQEHIAELTAEVLRRTRP
jgi:hypothetical protein